MTDAPALEWTMAGLKGPIGTVGEHELETRSFDGAERLRLKTGDTAQAVRGVVL